MKKIDLDKAPVRAGTGYPPPYDAPCKRRRGVKLSDAAGLTQIGVNRMHLPPGEWSSQRHWHAIEDEFVYVLEGEVVLVTDAGEEVFRVGDCAGFKAGDADGHHFQNRSDREAVLLQVGLRGPGGFVDYPDIDLAIPDEATGFAHKDGKPYG
ncbi:cupin domain-containing protein [Caulobacter sp. S45]|uniref:cupin domain-containing protein n=1 Tax=Caulobacter sp. S45 TaxID=1641861 RepID=UPI00131B19BC|nr:cupin domain-containing protein [Caulobacter sp. S45]